MNAKTALSWSTPGSSTFDFSGENGRAPGPVYLAHIPKTHFLLTFQGLISVCIY